MNTSNPCKAEIKVQANGVKWLKISLPRDFVGFETWAREIAIAHGVDLSSATCRVIWKGRKVWGLDVNTCGYFLP